MTKIDLAIKILEGRQMKYESQSINFFVPGNPVPQGRPKFARIGNAVRCYDQKKSSEWKQFIALRAAACGVKPFDKSKALLLNVCFILSRPASVSEKKRPHPTCKPDLDNLIKATKDGLKGIAWHDDSQVVTIVAKKQYGNQPGISILIDEVEI